MYIKKTIYYDDDDDDGSYDDECGYCKADSGVNDDLQRKDRLKELICIAE